MKNERPNAKQNSLKCVRPQQTRIAPYNISITLAVSGNVPAAAVPLGEWRGVGGVERDSQIRTITLVIVALSLRPPPRGMIKSACAD